MAYLVAYLLRFMEQGEALLAREKKELEEEHERLVTVDRPKVIEELKVARSYGDLRENSEYDTARKKQGMIESRITEIEGILKNASIIDDVGEKGEIVSGSDVEVEVAGEGKKTYSVGCEGKGVLVSLHSVVGEALLGKRVGDSVTVVLPKRTVEMVVKKVS